MAHDPVRALHALLERERKALRTGALDQLAPLTDEKTRLMTRLQRDRYTRPTLDRLRDQVVRNSRLLEAVRRGAAAAQAQIDEIRNGGPPLDTYDSHGQRNCLNRGASRLERRA